MREQFEVLTKIAQALNEHQSIFFDEEMNRYKTLSSIAADAMVTLYIDGAWYAYQEQQEKIARLQSALDDLKKTCNDVLDLGVSDEFERGWGCAHRRVLCRIEAIIGADK